jgi:hypothetical protein
VQFQRGFFGLKLRCVAGRTRRQRADTGMLLQSPVGWDARVAVLRWPLEVEERIAVAEAFGVVGGGKELGVAVVAVAREEERTI